MEFSIIELLEELKADDSWLNDEALRTELCNKMIYFIIEN